MNYLLGVGFLITVLCSIVLFFHFIKAAPPWVSSLVCSYVFLRAASFFLASVR